MAPREFEQLKLWFPNLRWLKPEEAPQPSPPIHVQVNADETAPLPERLAQLLENMQPGFRKRLCSGLLLVVFGFVSDLAMCIFCDVSVSFY